MSGATWDSIVKTLGKDLEYCPACDGHGYHCSIYSLAKECGVTLVPTREQGAAWIDASRRCFYDATASLGIQAAAVCAALALDKYPDNAMMRAWTRVMWLSRCLQTLGPELTSYAPQMRV